MTAGDQPQVRVGSIPEATRWAREAGLLAVDAAVRRAFPVRPVAIATHTPKSAPVQWRGPRRVTLDGSVNHLARRTSRFTTLDGRRGQHLTIQSLTKNTRGLGGPWRRVNALVSVTARVGRVNQPAAYCRWVASEAVGIQSLGGEHLSALKIDHGAGQGCALGPRAVQDSLTLFFNESGWVVDPLIGIGTRAGVQAF